MNPDSTLAVTNTCPKDGVHLSRSRYVPFDKTGADLLFGFISQRYEHRSLVVTTNLPFARWSPASLSSSARSRRSIE